MIKIHCVRCSHSFSVKDEFAGRKGKCPQCNGPIQIPVSSVEALPTSTVQARRSTSRQASKSKSAAKSGIILAFAGLASLLMAGVALLFYLGHSDDSTREKSDASKSPAPSIVVENQPESTPGTTLESPDKDPGGTNHREKANDVLTAAVDGSEIVVPNFSFEEPALRDEDTPGEERCYTSATDHNTTEVPGWIVNFSKQVGTAGVIDPGNGRFAGAGGNPGEKSIPGTGHGHRSAFITHIAGDSCLTTIQPLTKVAGETTYTAKVSVGYGLNSPSPGTVTLKLLAGNRIAAMKHIKPDEIKQGDLRDYSVSFTTGPNDSLVGEDLRLRLEVSGDVSQTGFAQAMFDNVRIQPAPATANQIAAARTSDHPIEPFADPQDFKKPTVFGSLFVVPHFGPSAPQTATRFHYRVCVAENDCRSRDNLPAWKIAFLFHWLRGPGRPNKYPIETNLYSGRSEYPHLSRVVPNQPSVQKPFEAESALHLSVPDNGRDGVVGAKSRSPEMFPTIDLEIDGFKDFWKREQVSQTNLNGKEVFIEIERMGLAAELQGWNVSDKLPEGQYRIWRAKASWNDKSHTVDFVLPDAGAQYYD